MLIQRRRQPCHLVKAQAVAEAHRQPHFASPSGLGAEQRAQNKKWNLPLHFMAIVQIHRWSRRKGVNAAAEDAPAPPAVGPSFLGAAGGEKSRLSRRLTRPCLCVWLCSAQMSHFIIKLMRSEHARALPPPWLKCSVFAEAAWAFSTSPLGGDFNRRLSQNYWEWWSGRSVSGHCATRTSCIPCNKFWRQTVFYGAITRFLLAVLIGKSTVATLICNIILICHYWH